MLNLRFRHHFPGLQMDVAFEAPKGVTALFGRSGAGKTTVINAVAGLIRPDEGRITIDGRALFDSATNENLPPARRAVGYVFQDARLFPHLTVRQNLTYGQWAARRGNGEDPDRIIALLGIEPLLPRRPGTLSGGEKQRVAIGRAILSNPQILLMDEPLAALDEARKAEILPFLERLRDEIDLPILYVSHAMAEVARLATTLVLMDKGRVTACGPVAHILSDPSTAPTLGLREAGALLMARVAAQSDDGLTRLDSAAGPIWLPQLAANIGSTLRLRILAQDVMLATEHPKGLSALNILPAVIEDIRLGDGPGALIRLSAGGEPILARITRRSAATLNLTKGQQVFAVLKAVSVARENVGQADHTP